VAGVICNWAARPARPARDLHPRRTPTEVHRFEKARRVVCSPAGCLFWLLGPFSAARLARPSCIIFRRFFSCLCAMILYGRGFFTDAFARPAVLQQVVVSGRDFSTTVYGLGFPSRLLLAIDRRLFFMCVRMRRVQSFDSRLGCTLVSLFRL